MKDFIVLEEGDKATHLNDGYTLVAIKNGYAVFKRET